MHGNFVYKPCLKPFYGNAGGLPGGRLIHHYHYSRVCIKTIKRGNFSMKPYVVGIY